MNNCYFRPHDPAFLLPSVDEDGLSDFVVVFTEKGERDIAQYDANKKLWYSVSDPTGFGKVWRWSPFIEPEDFKEDKQLYDFEAFK